MNLNETLQSNECVYETFMCILAIIKSYKRPVTQEIEEHVQYEDILINTERKTHKYIGTIHILRHTFFEVFEPPSPPM